jgi:methyl-accepting chemotaxis protein
MGRQRGKWLIIGIIAGNAVAILVTGWQFGWISWVNALLLANGICLVGMQLIQMRQLERASNLIGETDGSQPLFTVLAEHVMRARQLSAEIRRVIAGIDGIGQESFTSVLSEMKDDEMREPLLQAHRKIQELREKEKQNTWITLGVAAMVELKHKENDLSEYAAQVISTVVKYLSANQGGFFLLKTESDLTRFELVASYAYGKKKFLEKFIQLGEGLIGQVYFEKEIIYLTEVPRDYVKITSGLGEALPRCVCVVPLLSEGKVLGALEIASFHELRSEQLEYLKQIGEVVGYNLNAIEGHKKTEQLLRESQSMAQEVKSQEEELRQNMEELTATQEQMRRKEKELDAVMASLSTVELDLAGNVTQANPVFLGITGYSSSDIVGKLYKSLIPQHGNDPIQYEMMWSSILSGRSFSGEFRIVNKAQKEMWMAGNFTPILNDAGEPYKVMVISLFTTQDKEKLFELQEMVTALKNCFPMAEINPDLTFKSANDLFLAELGIRRIELKKAKLQTIFANGSLVKLQQMLGEQQMEPNSVTLSVADKQGAIKDFSTMFIRIGSANERRKKGLLILRNQL